MSAHVCYDLHLPGAASPVVLVAVNRHEALVQFKHLFGLSRLPNGYTLTKAKRQ